MPPGAILNLDDPYVGIETHFARETFLYLGLGGRQFTKASDEEPLCGAGPNNSAVPSSRLSLTNMAPASSAPRRRTAANAPSMWQRRI
jgi:hypothetical protein